MFLNLSVPLVMLWGCAGWPEALSGPVADYVWVFCFVFSF